MRRFLSIACVLMLGLLAAAPSPEKLEFRLQLRKGQVRHMRVTVDQSVNLVLQPNQPQDQQTTVVLGYSFTVDDVNAQGSAAIDVRYDSVVLHCKTSSGVVEYDSTHPPAQVPPMAAPLAALVGQGYRMTLSPEGRVLDVSGLNQLLSRVLAKISGPEVDKALRKQLNEENVKANLESIFAPFPDHPVAIGEPWTRNSHSSLGLPLTVQSNYTLKSVADGLAMVDISGNTSTAPAAVVDMGRMKMTCQLKGEQQGSIQIEQSSGWTRSAHFSQKLTGNATIEVPGAQPQSVPITIQTLMLTETQS